jgi:hypothetical protein
MYFMIDNFAAGLDTRKSALTSPPGVLTSLINATVTPGGEIRKRMAFTKVATLTGTFGLAGTESVLHFFTRNVAPGGGLPANIAGTAAIYDRIPNASATLKQTDYDNYDGNIYLVCQDTALTGNAANPHYYANVATDAAGKGFYIKTYQSKVYGVAGKYLNYSTANDPTNWTTGTGAGFHNLAKEDSKSEVLTSLEVYYDKMAIFSTEAAQLWTVDPDPNQTVYDQLLRGAGTVAPRSALQYGSGDVLYLSTSGIRSLKARDASNSAAVSDIGSPVDGIIRNIVRTNGQAYANAAVALLEPVVGRFWMVFPTQILVLSYFPGPKITAWSLYTLPFTVDYADTCNNRIWLRSGDDLYLYGGPSNTDLDNCGVSVIMPYLDGGKPGHKKQFMAVDATVSGNWTMKVSYDFANPNNEETVATLSAPTWNDGTCELAGYGSHVSLRMYNNDAGDAVLSNMAIHFNMAEDED